MLARCAVHDVDEEDDGAYRVCGECWHVYRTRWHLRWHQVRLIWGWRHVEVGNWRRALWDAVTRPVSTIWSCPLCLHDF